MNPSTSLDRLTGVFPSAGRARRAAVLLCVTCAFALTVGVSSAFALSPTNAPLAGSNFQGGDGNQDNPGADKNGDGVVDADWQAKTASLGTSLDDNAQDTAFAGGDKETSPGTWGFNIETGGVNPRKDNVLAAWSQTDVSVSGPPTNFLYLAFNREAHDGNTFLTFELNQRGDSWLNGSSSRPISCRTTNDLLISYNVNHGGSPPSVDIIVYRWISDTSDTITGCSRTGHFETLDPQSYAQGAINATAITNYLSPAQLGASLAEGTFGETALNLTAILSKLGINPCTGFASASMHSRSSESISSQLQDMVGPMPVSVNPCSITVKKTGEPIKHDDDTESFDYELKNSGQVAVTVDKATGLTDDKCAPVTYVSGDTDLDGTLDVAETWKFHCTYTVKHSDENAQHQIINTVTARGKVGRFQLSDTATWTTLIIHPAIDVRKTATETAVHMGDTIHYTVTAKNTGDTSLTVTPSDTGCAPFSTANFTLAADATRTITCSHVATAGDGTSYKNTACATGVDVIGGVKGTVSDCDDVTTTILHPAIDVIKTAGETAVHVGDTIHYMVSVKNTGDTSLGVTPSDLGCTGFDNASFTLAVNATKTLTCTHVATLGDGGSYKNEACAQGVDSLGGPKGTVSDCGDVTTKIYHPGIDVVKTAGETAVHVGDTIHYTVKVTNTGDVDLTVTPADTQCTGFDSSPFTLAVGATKTLTCTHVATAGDATKKDNTACAEGVDPISGKVSDCDTVIVKIYHPGIEVVKTSGETAVHVGDTIHYTVKVTNTGDVDLTVTPADTGCTALDSTPFALAVGATKTLACTHQATAADGPAKANEACAEGVDAAGGPKGTVSDCDTVTTDVIHPKIKIDKTERIAGDPNYVDGPINGFVGDKVEYEMTVTIPAGGDTPLDVVFTDNECDAGTLTGLSGDTANPGKLDPGETWVYHCSHVLTAADKPSLTNTAKVDGTDKLGQTVSDQDSVVAAVLGFKITGHKFEDRNANGKKDAGEPGIAGWTFYLDANDNGQLDAGETTTQTDANGDYAFTGLNPGSYIVRETLPSGWHCSTPSPCEYRFTLNARDPDRTGADFGNWHDATVEGVKFHDLDGDGAAREAGEGGLGGWTFYVDYNGNGTLDSGEPSDASAADGSYKIGGVKPGTYAVREVGQASWTCSFPATCEYDLTFGSKDARTGVDFGNWNPGTVSGSKYEDKNNNGTRDGADTPLQGVTFYVDYNGNNALDTGEPTAVSAADGTWTITGVKPGTFNVLEVQVAGYTCTEPATVCRYTVTLQAGETQTGKVFGNAPPAQLVLPSRVTPGTAKLSGPTGCTAKAFTARISGTKVATVTFVLDGKAVKRFTKTIKSGVYALRVDPAKLRIGVHRLVVSVTFQNGSGTRPKTLRLSFQRCAKKLAVPRFTG